MKQKSNQEPRNQNRKKFEISPKNTLIIVEFSVRKLEEVLQFTVLSMYMKIHNILRIQRHTNLIHTHITTIRI